MKPISKNTSGSKVFVGLSGGVDSAVSVALLKEQGYDVVGVFIKVWTPDFVPCTWRKERRDAMRVAAHLKIPFLFFDFEEEYKKGVADYFIEEYRRGRTPNPDVACNREIKFGAFWSKAKEMGASYIATGHYAQISPELGLVEGRDADKDQSYFLWTLTPADLRHCLFPIGHLKKDEVRSLARKFGLPVAEKKDSQGICFLGQIKMDDFLSHFIATEPGHVLDTKGETIGSHKGALYYTLGERRGFDITEKTPYERPYYIVSKDMQANTITVSNDTAEIVAHSPAAAKLTHINWIQDEQKKIEVRIRYRGEKVRAVLGDNEIRFETPVRGLAPGQSIVFYSGNNCLGGAVCDAILST